MKRILITGGSSGIGYEMSRIWAGQNYEILWVSHDAEELQSSFDLLSSEFPTVQLHFFQQDLTRENAAVKVKEWADSIGPVGIVINNAGIGTYGHVNEIPLEKELQMIQLNAISLYRMTRIFLTGMMERNNGTIINICSNSAFQPTPRMTTYAATKGFVYQFSRGLQQEMKLQKSKVRIITVCPAAISDTPFKSHLPPVKTFNGLATTTAKEVARDVWNGYLGKKDFVISGQKMRWLYRIRFLIPEFIEKKLVLMETGLEQKNKNGPL